MPWTPSSNKVIEDWIFNRTRQKCFIESRKLALYNIPPLFHLKNHPQKPDMDLLRRDFGEV